MSILKVSLEAQNVDLQNPKPFSKNYRWSKLKFVNASNPDFKDSKLKFFKTPKHGFFGTPGREFLFPQIFLAFTLYFYKILE